MISRRIFNGCALCTAVGLIAAPVEAQTTAAADAVTRQLLSRADLPGSSYEAVQVNVVVKPAGFIAWHTHPGIESSCVLEGEATLMVKSRPNLRLQVGRSLMIPPETPHAVQNSNSVLRIAATFIVEKGKPLSTPVQDPNI